MDIEFIENVPTHVGNWNGVKDWVNSCVVNEGLITGSLSFVFMSDEDLLGYNRDFLEHDFYTDVITFDDSEYPEINGDILISIDRVLDNCKILKTSYKEEILRVCIHGVLHLCGYKDKEAFDIKIMRAKEVEYLALVSFEL